MSGTFPDGWIRAELGEAVDVLDFEREPINTTERNERIQGKERGNLFAYYGATGQVGWIDQFRTDGQRVLLGEDGAPFLDPNKNKAYLASGRYWVNNHAHVLRGAGGAIDNKFLCHQLNTVDFQPFVSGSTRLKLTSAAMKRIPLVVAPHSEQVRIVDKLEELLSDLDAGVAELKAAQKKLAQYSQSLLKAAVEGRLTEAWRAQHGEPEESGAQLLARILRERRARWEAKQLAKFDALDKAPPKGWQGQYPQPLALDATSSSELPRGWAWASLDMLIDDGPQNGLYLPGDRYGRGCAILRIDDFQNSWVRPREELNLVEVDAVALATYSLTEGDLVVNRVNSMTHLGKTLVVDAGLGGALFESNMMRFSLNAAVNLQYVGAYLGSELGRKRLIRDAKWAVNQASINQQDVKRTPVPLAPVDEQGAVVEVVSSALMRAADQGSAIVLALRQSTAQRKNILQAAFSGQLVPQDPNEEPASVLLARIRAERAAVAAIGTRRGRRVGTAL